MKPATLLVALVLLGPRVSLAVERITIQKLDLWQQTAAEPPIGSKFHSFVTTVRASGDFEIFSAELRFIRPPAIVQPLVATSSRTFAYRPDFFATEEELDQAFPQTTYQVALDLGAGPVTTDIILDERLYPEAVPAYTGTSYADLLEYDYLEEQVVTINGAAAPGGRRATRIDVTLTALFEVEPTWSASFPPETTAFTIPAQVLQPTLPYAIRVIYVGVESSSAPAFPGATVEVHYGRQTQVYFNTLDTPTPGDMNCDRRIDFNDVDGFVAALVGRAAYEAAFPGCRRFAADVNDDLRVDFDDIPAFVACLVAGACAR